MKKLFEEANTILTDLRLRDRWTGDYLCCGIKHGEEHKEDCPTVLGMKKLAEIRSLTEGGINA